MRGQRKAFVQKLLLDAVHETVLCLQQKQKEEKVIDKSNILAA